MLLIVHTNTACEVSQRVEYKKLKLNIYGGKMIKIMVGTNLWQRYYSYPHDYCYWLIPQCTWLSCRKMEVAGGSAPHHSLHRHSSHTASTSFHQYRNYLKYVRASVFIHLW